MATSPHTGNSDILLASPPGTYPSEPARGGSGAMKPNQVSQVVLYGIPIVSLVIDGQERLCLAQISNTLLKNYSYNEIHNRRVALGITCVQCTPVQLEILRRAGAMPISSRRCGMITKREAERLCKSFLGENRPPKLPDNFAFDVSHECAWGCRGSFIPARYNSSRAKCIKCTYCSMYFSPNKFIFHSHRTPEAKYTQPDAANFNSWRRHLKLTDRTPPDEMVFAWEDVKAMFNGGSRKRALTHGHCSASLSALKAGAAALPPHLLAPELAHKRSRFPEDDDELEGAPALPSKPPRSYPVIPVPSKGFGVLQKFPASSLFPSPYSFPAFGLCQKKDDGDPAGAQKGTGLSGLFWPGRKDTFYPPFCMFWPPRTPGGIPVPTYLQPQPGALTSLAESPSLRQAFLDLSEQSDGSAVSTPRDGLFDADASPDLPAFPTRKPSYHSAFRPVGKDADSLAKLHGPSLEEYGPERQPSPGTSCSYQSDSADSDDEEQEVDVESHRLPGEEDGAPPYLQSRGLGEQGEDRGVLVGHRKEAPHLPSRAPESEAEQSDPLLAPRKDSQGEQEEPPKDCSPLRTPPEEPGYKEHQKSKEDSHVIPPAKEDSSFPAEKSKDNHFFITDTDHLTGEFWREMTGDPTHETATPQSLKKDVENMGKEELQKVLFEQIDLRRRLEQEFQVLKGSASFPVFNNFQEQMKRELAYREEVVQQLQIIPYAASLIRKEKLGAHLSKS